MIQVVALKSHLNEKQMQEKQMQAPIRTFTNYIT